MDTATAARITAMAQAMAETAAARGVCSRDDLVAQGFTRAEIAALLPAAAAIARTGARVRLTPDAHPSRLMPPGAPRRSQPRQMAYAQAMAARGVQV